MIEQNSRPLNGISSVQDNELSVKFLHPTKMEYIELPNSYKDEIKATGITTADEVVVVSIRKVVEDVNVNYHIVAEDTPELKSITVKFTNTEIPEINFYGVFVIRRRYLIHLVNGEMIIVTIKCDWSAYNNISSQMQKSDKDGNNTINLQRSSGLQELNVSYTSYSKIPAPVERLILHTDKIILITETVTTDSKEF